MKISGPLASSDIRVNQIRTTACCYFLSAKDEANPTTTMTITLCHHPFKNN
jgi:hypothetical protein